jgi:hypothetical protein
VLTHNETVGADRSPSAYAPARAFHESSSLASATCVVHFCEIMGQFVRSGTGEESVNRLAAIVARETRRRGLAPERMLTALRIADCTLPQHDAEPIGARMASRRYLRATRICLAEYFRLRPS